VEDPLQLRTADLEWREVEGEIVALDLRTSTYLAVNGTGLLLWKALVDGATETALQEQLRKRHGLTAEQAATDVRAFLDSLAEQDLLSG
jgi:hypothetical protein